MAEVANPPAICGEIRTVGSAPRYQLVLSEGDRNATLVGARANDLVGYPGRVCVDGKQEGPVPGQGLVVTVTHYHLVGDGKHAPIVGTIRKVGASYYVETPQRRRLRVVANDSTTLASTVNHLVWLTATWSEGALHLIRIGPLGG